MKNFSIIYRLLLTVVFTLAITSVAQAQATRTWVSGVGDDVNPCSRTAPCKTWAGAISKTAAGGEINALDPGGFGTLTITKSITVEGTQGQGFGSTLNSGGINGFVLNDSLSGAPNSIVVTLRNLAINGAGTTKGLNGVRALSFSRLYMENVSIENQSNHGIDIAASTSVKAFLSNVSVRNIGQRGLSAQTTSGKVTVSVMNSNFSNCNIGVLATDNAKISAFNTVSSNNALAGFQAQSLVAGRPAELNLYGCTTAGQDGAGDFGVAAGGGGGSGDVVRLKDCGISQNATGVSVFVGGSVITFQRNVIDGNTTNVSGALTPGTPQ